MTLTIVSEADKDGVIRPNL